MIGKLGSMEPTFYERMIDTLVFNNLIELYLRCQLNINLIIWILYFCQSKILKMYFLPPYNKLSLVKITVRLTLSAQKGLWYRAWFARPKFGLTSQNEAWPQPPHIMSYGLTEWNWAPKKKLWPHRMWPGFTEYGQVS